MPVGSGYAWAKGVTRGPGNHGVVIPRDRELLHQMYWVQRMTTTEMAKHFNVTHKSMMRAMAQVGVPTRGRLGGASKITRPCKDCGGTVEKKRHPGNGSMYGTRCAECRRKHYNKLSREYQKRPDRQIKVREYMKRWYYEGPINLNGERAWISTNRALLRRVKRTLAHLWEQT